MTDFERATRMYRALVKAMSGLYGGSQGVGGKNQGSAVL